MEDPSGSASGEVGGYQFGFPEEFGSLSGCISEAIRGSKALITEAREIVFELRDFKRLNNVLKKKKVKGFFIRTRWFDVGCRKVRLVVYPRGNSQARNQLSFFIQKEKSLESFDSTTYMLYSLSIGGNLKKVSKGRFRDEGEELGWVRFVDLGLLLDVNSGCLVDNTVTFRASVMVLDESFSKGDEALRLGGFEVGKKEKGQPFLWHMANFSEILLRADSMVSPSFKFGKYLLHIVIFIRDGDIRARLCCDGSHLDDKDKNLEIVYSFSLSVNGEVIVRDFKTTFCVQSSDNDVVSLLEVTAIQERTKGYEVALACRLQGLNFVIPKIRKVEIHPECPSVSPQGGLGIGIQASGLTAAASSSQHQPIQINEQFAPQALIPTRLNDSEFSHAKAEVTQQRQTLSDDSTTDPTSTTGLGKILLNDDDLKVSSALDTPAGVFRSLTESAQVPRGIDLSPVQPLQSHQPPGSIDVIGGSISDLGALCGNIVFGSLTKPVQGPRDIDLYPGQPLQSNQPSSSIDVISDGSISELGAFGDNVGGSSANSGGMREQVHNLQMLDDISGMDASSVMPATVLQPVAPTMEDKKQKGQNTQGSGIRHVIVIPKCLQ